MVGRYHVANSRVAEQLDHALEVRVRDDGHDLRVFGKMFEEGLKGFFLFGFFGVEVEKDEVGFLVVGEEVFDAVQNVDLGSGGHERRGDPALEALVRGDHH